MKKISTLYIVIGVIIGFSIAFVALIESPTIQTTEAGSADVYPNSQTLIHKNYHTH